jgi:hypothetical protein
MPAKDRYHDTVKRAIEKDGWKITREQVRVTFEDRYLWIDLQAQKESSEQIILVEVKEVEDVASPVEALANAVGKYLLYKLALKRAGSGIPLFMAISEAAYNGIMQSGMGSQVMAEFQLSLVVFDPVNEVIRQWIP